jgi:creatinine amidohydrolase/Fe(II)-dependent formamide hydrolase-like protein
MTGLVQDIVLSLALGGFREIILVNGHYTNSIALSAAFMEIGDRLPKGTIAFPFNYWDALPPEQLSAYLGAEVGLHANIGETSAVLAVNKSLVNLKNAVREYPPFPVEPTPAMVSAFFFSATGTLPRASQSGVWGDPSGSTAERGREYLDQIESACVRFVQNVESIFNAFPDTAR